MAITTENRKRRVDTAGPTQPTEVWHGKTWFDYNTNKLKVYNSDSASWIDETVFRFYTVRSSDAVTVSGGAFAP